MRSGKAAPVGLFVETFGSETVDPARIEKAITSVFDLRPGAIVRDLDLLRPDLRTDRPRTATSVAPTWTSRGSSTDKVEELKASV